MSKYYYYINDTGRIIKTVYTDNEFDKARIKLGNIFLDEETAKQMKDKLEIYVELKRYANKHNDEEMDWDNIDQRKYFMTYNHYFNKLSNGINTCLEIMGQVHFNDDKMREKAIEDIGEEKIKKLFKEKR